VAEDEEQTAGEESALPRPLPLEGKRGLVLGVANRRSIAWAIAKRLSDDGAQLGFTYQGERLGDSVRKLAESAGATVGRSASRPMRRAA